MEEENGVIAEETAEVSQPEENTEATEAPMEVPEESSEETENTAPEVSEKPKETPAAKRIKELLEQNKILRSQVQQPVEQTQLEGVDESGIDPIKFAETVRQQATKEALSAVQVQQQYAEATTKFPLVKDNNLVRARAAELVDQSYSPLQAAEIATLEFNDFQEQSLNQSKSRQIADSKLKTNSQIPSAGNSANDSGYFTFKQIDSMSLEEYRANKDEINRQLNAGLIS